MNTLLKSVTPGVVINALLSIGFECTQLDEVDGIMATFQRVERGQLITVVVASHGHDMPKQENWEYSPPVGLASPLAWLHHELSKVQCFFDAGRFREDPTAAFFMRQDTLKHPTDGEFTIRVNVRATFERAPA